jgi:trehalose 6-phosphate synthase
VELEAAIGDRRLITRVDRIELSKNLVRGFLAYEDLLATHREWREQVVFAAFVYPSRQGVPDYAAYRAEVDTVVQRVNERFATPGWTPILYDDTDDFPRSVAALARADVVLVNPVRDGLNLVAKEAALVNDRDGVLVLSREAGAWVELHDAVVDCHPFDVVDTAAALHRALELEGEERAALARRWRERATARTPADWLVDNLAAAGGV